MSIGFGALSIRFGDAPKHTVSGAKRAGSLPKAIKSFPKAGESLPKAIKIFAKGVVNAASATLSCAPQMLNGAKEIGIEEINIENAPPQAIMVGKETINAVIHLLS
ncbi:MAG TPA: hypothetical protein PL009_09950 [Flavipsychrobacter sp.]|nr:hypothetical protein [Flavipsychrobacter sp.]